MQECSIHLLKWMTKRVSENDIACHPSFNSFNPSTPTSDQHVTSTDSIHTLSNKQVMRILKLIK